MGYQPNHYPLTKAQEALLARGPNFTIVPRYPPKEIYIAAVEEVCMKLPQILKS